MKATAVFAIGILALTVLLSGVAVASTVATISTDKSSYAQGENITITVVNNCRGPLAINGYWVENEKGDRIFSPQLPAYTVILSPGGSYQYTWNQVDNDGNQVPPNRYTVEFEYGSAGITIIAPEDESPVQVLTDRNSYIQGDEVLITISNAGQEPVVLNGYWVEDKDGVTVYSPPMLMFVQYIQPGETCQYFWDLTDYNGGKVQAGTYRVHIAQDSTQIKVIEAVVSASVTTDRQTYAAGETVTMTVENTGNVAIVITGYWVENAARETIYSQPTLDYVRYLQPGSSYQCVWNQVDEKGNAVLPGTYTMHVSQGGSAFTVAESITPPPMLDSHADNGHHRAPTPRAHGRMI